MGEMPGKEKGLDPHLWVKTDLDLPSEGLLESCGHKPVKYNLTRKQVSADQSRWAEVTVVH